MHSKFPEISVAPMMDLTDRHCRYFLRLFCPDIVLYTEMITINALIYGDQQKFLRYHPAEQPIAIQLGGSSPKDLAFGAKLAEQYGFCEVNLNIGCPSERVQKGKIGACLMAEPELVADCIQAMTEVVNIPVTIKTRIGIDHLDSYKFLTNFIEKTSKAGCAKFIIHARKAILGGLVGHQSGLSPKENRTIPPLNYERVYQLKKDFPELTIVLNGGISSIDQIKQALGHLDGVMIGREAYYNPYLLAQIHNKIFQHQVMPSRWGIIDKLLPYITSELENGTRWVSMARHYMGLFKGQKNARGWRQFLSESRDITAGNIIEKFKTIKNLIQDEIKSNPLNSLNQLEAIGPMSESLLLTLY